MKLVKTINLRFFLVMMLAAGGMLTCRLEHEQEPSFVLLEFLVPVLVIAISLFFGKKMNGGKNQSQAKNPANCLLQAKRRAMDLCFTLGMSWYFYLVYLHCF